MKQNEINRMYDALIGLILITRLQHAIMKTNGPDCLNPSIQCKAKDRNCKAGIKNGTNYI